MRVLISRGGKRSVSTPKNPFVSMAMPRSPCPISSQALLTIALLSLILVITIIIIVITIFFFTIILAEVVKALYCFLVIVLEIRKKNPQW